jgi:hypothetical protein
MPIRIRLQTAILIDGPGKEVINKGHIMSNEYAVADFNPFTNKGVGGNLTVFANRGALLDFYKSPNFGAFSDATFVGIDKIKNAHIRTDQYIAQATPG